MELENPSKSAQLAIETTSPDSPRLKIHDSFIWQYVMGDTPGISRKIDQLSNSYLRWTIRFVESLLRTFGALIFVNNVWSGVLFCTAVFIHDPFSALLGIFGMVLSYFTAIFLNIETGRLRSGVATFNGFMVASFIGANSVSRVGIKWNPWLLFPAAFFSLMRCAGDRLINVSLDYRFFLFVVPSSKVHFTPD